MMEQTAPGEYREHTDPQFWNQIGPFGGWLAATAMRAMRLEVDPSFGPRSFNANFVGAIEPGEVVISVTTLRKQRTLVAKRAEIAQRGEVAVSAECIFGQQRPGPSYPHPVAPLMALPSQYPRWRELEVFASFTSAFDYRLAHGTPLLGEGPFDSGGYVRLENCVVPGPEEMLLLADAWFPAPWAGLAEPVPVSTLALSVLFHHAWDSSGNYAHEFLSVRHKTTEINEGYANEHGELWLPDGKIALQCQQLTWINFAKPHGRIA